jgi:hypothetical protein
MAWATPKCDWATDDVVGTADFNRIESNAEALNGSASDLTGMATIASAANLDIEKRLNIVTGTTDIGYIKTTGFVAGAIAYLYFKDGGADIHNEAGSPPPGYAKIKTMTGGNLTGYANRFYVIHFDGTYWNLMGAY